MAGSGGDGGDLRGCGRGEAQRTGDASFLGEHFGADRSAGGAEHGDHHEPEQQDEEIGHGLFDRIGKHLDHSLNILSGDGLGVAELFAEEPGEPSGPIGEGHGDDREQNRNDEETQDAGDPAHARSIANRERLARAAAEQVDRNEAGGGQPDHESERRRETEKSGDAGDKQSHTHGHRMVKARRSRPDIQRGRGLDRGRTRGRQFNFDLVALRLTALMAESRVVG